MPVTQPTPPDESLGQLARRISTIQLDPDGEVSYNAHRVFTLDQVDVLAGRGLDAAYLTGWRYTPPKDADQNHVVEVGVDLTSGTHTLNHVNTGSHVDHFVDLFDRVHDHPTLRDEDYEVRILRVPTCYVLAAWFASINHDHDFLVPLHPVNSHFEAGREYTAEEFMTVLVAAAGQMNSVGSIQNTV